MVLLRDDGDEIRRVVKTERSRASDEETLSNTFERHLASLTLRPPLVCCLIVMFFAKKITIVLAKILILPQKITRYSIPAQKVAV